MQVLSLGLEDPLEEEMATHSSIVAWKIPWTEEPGGLQSMGSQSVRPDRGHTQNLQCCVSFKCIAKCSVLFLFQLRLLQDIEYSSLCCAAGPI